MVIISCANYQRAVIIAAKEADPLCIRKYPTVILRLTIPEVKEMAWRPLGYEKAINVII